MIKERLIILIIFVLLLSLSSGIYSAKKKDLYRDVRELKKRYEKIADLSRQYLALSEMEKKKGRMLKGGLLGYIQKSSGSIGISDNIGSIKPLPGDREAVDVLYQKLDLAQIISIFREIDGVSNLRVRSFSISRRFDNPGLADLNIQIEKIK